MSKSSERGCGVGASRFYLQKESGTCSV